jgi:hypothetical protein
MTAVETFNLSEAALWFACAMAVGVASRRSATGARRNAWLAVVAFIAFGVSDLIEIQTGAWWRPWWLFVLKAACVLVLVGCFLRHRRFLPRR